MRVSSRTLENFKAAGLIFKRREREREREREKAGVNSYFYVLKLVKDVCSYWIYMELYLPQKYPLEPPFFGSIFSY